MTVATGAVVTCTITNDDQAAHLTLVKTVTNDNGGTAKAIDWTLTRRRTPRSRARPRSPGPAVPPDRGRARPVHRHRVHRPLRVRPVELGLPRRDLTAGGVVTVATGADVTCTITNDDQAAHLTVIKSVTNDNGGSAAKTTGR